MPLFDEAMRRDPYPAYAELRHDSPVVRLPGPGPGLWAVFDHEGVRRVLADHGAFSSRVGGLGDGSFEWLLFLDPPRAASSARPCAFARARASAPKPRPARAGCVRRR